jgi:predicted anti-sigma-YlaC factor YlaD
MNECIDTDRLATVAGALEWDVERRLDHLARCAHCRAELRELAQLHELLAGEIAPAPGLADRVAASIAAEQPAREPRRPRERAPLLLALVFALATLTAFTVLLLGPETGGAPASPPAQALAAVLAGALAAWWTHRSAARAGFD